MADAPWIDPWRHSRLPWQSPGDLRADARPACALLDMAFAPDAWTQLSALTAEMEPLFTHRYAGNGLDRLSPCLVALPDEAGARERSWQALLDLSRGAPMLSVLRSTANPNALAEHLRRIWEGCSSTGQPWLLRWADGRTASRLLDALDEAQRIRVLAGLHDWHLPTRIGDWMCVTGKGGTQFDADARPLTFTAAQETALRSGSQADAITRFILQRPVLRPEDMQPSQVHRCAEHVLGRLARRGIDHLALAHRMTIKAVACWSARHGDDEMP
ncbi:DUF4123 domain-containing protein [Stenotrophomonas maltophilia]|uniref:DUF4123 domain-containing protein n=1 Tax=Stenotrophomonas maltophilia TaxID=40324 RepID=UPI001312BB78|nr:DUF4123 domain-containing protein [Stenotrophomonas maltophilia]MBA0284658.1 DUF4123 domain-containing protein [Stenotrophomonas maltophilia]MBA0322807.1 DUF4123 domain-containing protein [Stenotrophomonas maltophilia]